MPTARERLEALLPQMKSLTDKQNLSHADEKRLGGMVEEVRNLSAVLQGEKTLETLSGPATGSFHGASIGDLLGAGGTAGGAAHYSPGYHAGPVARGDTGWGSTMVKAAGAGAEFKAAGAGAEFKALVPSGSVVVPSLTAGIVRTADRPRSLLQVIPSTGLQGTDQYSYLRESVRTHAAAPVATGATKPTSVYSVARVDATVKTIAHLSERIPRQTLADANLLQAYVEGSLREGVELALEDQIMNGTGVGENLLGIDATSTIQQQAFSANIVTTARKAVTKLEAVNIDSATFVLAPADWESVELFADTSGQYMLGDSLPVDRAQRRLWGLPVVTSTTLTAGKGFLVDFKGSTQLWEREGVRVDWSENTHDAVAGVTDFERNLIRFRAEGRWGFAVTRPAGVVEIDTAA